MYQIIDNLPIDFEFSTKTKDDLKLYGVWFEENKDKRLTCLEEVVRSTHGFENWNLDFTSDSLKVLGKWFRDNLEKTKLSEEEYKLKRSKTPDYIEIDDWDLSIKTRSLIVDIGIYFGEIFIKKYKNLKWRQYFSKIKKDVNNGHMVIPNFGKLELNPILVVLSIGWGFARKTKEADSLHDLFEIWEKYL